MADFDALAFGPDGGGLRAMRTFHGSPLLGMLSGSIGSQSTGALQGRRPAVALVAAAAMVAVALWLLLPAADMRILMAEGGLVERVTLLGYALAVCVLSFGLVCCVGKRVWSAVFVLVLALAAREMDWHIHWTGKSVLKLSFYLGGAPAAHKAVGAACVLAVVAALAYLAAAHGRGLLRLLRAGTAPVATATIFVATIVLTKLLDRSVILVRGSTGAAAESAAALMLALEETVEIALPLLVTLAALQAMRALRQARRA